MARMTAFQILQGLETLHVRMPRHVENTRKIAQFLSANKSVAHVTYPELDSHPDHERAKARRITKKFKVPQFILSGYLLREAS